MEKAIFLTLTALVCLQHIEQISAAFPTTEDDDSSVVLPYYEYESDDVGLDDTYEDEVEPSEHYRVRRQAAAVDLSLDHVKDGKLRPVGKPHGFVGLSGSGNNKDNHHLSLGAGLGTVAWRSRNDRHSVGVGATVDQHRGRFSGHSYRSKPNVGVGIGYKFRF